MARTEPGYTRSLFAEAIVSDDVDGLANAVAVGGRLSNELLIYALIIGSHKSVAWLLNKNISADVIEGGLRGDILGEKLEVIGRKTGTYMQLKKVLCRKGVGEPGQESLVVTDLTPLMLAAVQNHARCAELLIASGACVDRIDDDGQSALMTGVYHGALATVKCLVNAGANVNLRSRRGLTPLIAACIFRSESKSEVMSKMIDFLLSNGADINAADEDCDTALMLVLRENFYENVRGLCDTARKIFLVRQLVEGGADVNVRGIRGRTPLMDVCRFARRGGDILTNYLLDHGANINAQCDNGWTPLMEAASCNSAQLVGLLLERGADINMCNDRGKSAIEVVCQRDAAVVAQYLQCCRSDERRTLATLIVGGADLRSVDICKYVAVKKVWKRRQEMKMQLRHLCREVIRKHLGQLYPGELLEKTILKIQATECQKGLPSEMIEFVADTDRFVVNIYCCSLP